MIHTQDLNQISFHLGLALGPCSKFGQGIDHTELKGGKKE